MQKLRLSFDKKRGNPVIDMQAFHYAVLFQQLFITNGDYAWAFLRKEDDDFWLAVIVATGPAICECAWCRMHPKPRLIS